MAVADGSHETAAVPGPLRVLDRKGALVTMVVAERRKATPARVPDPGGGGPVAVRGNQPALPKAVHAALDRAGEVGFAGCDTSGAVADGNGRHDER